MNKKCEFRGLLPKAGFPVDCSHCQRRVSREDVIACRESSFPSRGMGDVLARVADATGITTFVKAIAGEDCGCDGRQAVLNSLLQFRKPVSIDPVRVSIVITCGPGYEQWVDTAVASTERQGAGIETILLFDNCAIPGRYRGSKHRVVAVEFGSVQQGRMLGMLAAVGEMVLFLDADDELPDGFVATAETQLRAATFSDPRVAGVYPSIDYLTEDMTRKLSDFVPRGFDRIAFHRENYIACTTLTWRHALEVSWKETVGNDRIEDWHMWGQLIRDGWSFVKGEGLTLRCRKRADGMLAKQVTEYPQRYSMHEAPLTVFVPLSGRVWAWPALRDWLIGLPPRCRLVLCEASGSEEFSRLIQDAVWPLSDVRIYRHCPLRSGLAEEDRTQEDIAHQVGLSVASIYNRFAQECTTETALIIEDDILPSLSAAETVRVLTEGFAERVASVSGLYHSRYDRSPLAWLSSHGRSLSRVPALSIPRRGYIDIEGSGFGCLMIRRDALRMAPLAALPGDWFDPRLFRSLASLGWRSRLACAVRCEHRSETPVRHQFNTL